MSVRLETFVGEDEQIYARIVGGNGEPMFVSEGHPDPDDAENAVNVLVQSIQSHDFQVEFDAG